MSVASLFHHEGCGNKSLCNSLFAFMFPFSNTCSQSRYFHWNGSEIPQCDRKVIEGPFKCKLVCCKLFQLNTQYREMQRQVKNVIASLCCHGNSDVNKTWIIKNFHLNIVQLW